MAVVGHRKILRLSNEQNICYINNDIIIRNETFKDCLHLLHSAKFLLSKNVIINVTFLDNKNFAECNIFIT